MADGAQLGKLGVRLLIAFLKQQAKNLIGEEMADELGEMGKELLGLSIDAWLGGKGEQIAQAWTKARECFERACRKVEIPKGDEILQWMDMLPLEGLPELQAAIERLPQATDDGELRQALVREISKAWKSLTPEQARQATEQYLSCLKAGLASQPTFRETIMAQEILSQSRQLAQIRQETALIPDINKRIKRIELKLEALDRSGAGRPYRPPLQRPERVDHFVGREQELQQLIAALQPGAVITLCGPAGIGKSALAAEAVWRLAPDDKPPERFPDGVIYHTFYNQPSVTAALEHIALSFSEDLRPTPQEAARRALGGRTALLVLDGVENADADFPTLLDIHDRCAVLISTRPRHNAPAAWLDVLPLPEERSQELLRAWAAPKRVPNPAAKEICALLGGLPLAIRLAGRYLAQTEITPADYLDWLKATPLEALDRGQRQADSVPLLLERSLEQVSQAARQTLSVIGCLALAPCVPYVLAVALEKETRELLRPLGELVDYGLLRRSGERYEVSHALIHTYARQRLPLEDSALEHLAGYYTSMAQEQSRKGPPGYARLDGERAHLMRLLAACDERSLWQPTLKLAWAVEDYLDLTGRWSERLQAVETGLAAAQALDEKRYIGSFYSLLGLTYHDLGDARKAIGYHQQALEIARQIGDRRGEGFRLGNLGLAYAALGEARTAIRYYEQALEIARQIGDRRGEEAALGNLGNAYAALGDVRKAIEYYQQALAIARQIDDKRGEGNCLGNLGLSCASLGEARKAIEYYEQALEIARQIGDRRGEGYRLGNLGLAYAALGEARRAIEYYQQALKISREIGDRGGEGADLGNLGNAYADLGEVRKAIEYYEQALDIAREIGDRRGEGNRLGDLGNIYYSLGDPCHAIKYYQQALEIARQIGDKRGEGNSLGNLGIAHYSLGETLQAIEYYEQALEIARQIGDRRGEGYRLGNLGLAYAALGEARRAIEYYEQALKISREIGDRRGEALNSWNLGLAHEKEGELELAIQVMQRCVDYEREIGHPDAEEDAARVKELEKKLRGG